MHYTTEYCRRVVLNLAIVSTNFELKILKYLQIFFDIKKNRQNKFDQNEKPRSINLFHVFIFFTKGLCNQIPDHENDLTANFLINDRVNRFVIFQDKINRFQNKPYRTPVKFLF